ncbi:MAG: glucose-6-phosphate isomerase [Candidatus Hydrogenedentes bacterium]|nr:glucose-6-phosphate isomerase [Candidatus Hydrogenedentota bacterium]
MKDIYLDISFSSAEKVGIEHGFTEAELAKLSKTIEENHHILLNERKNKKYGFYDLYKDIHTIKKVEHTAEKFLSKGYKNFVVLGIGGSALGIIALNTALNPPFYNLLPQNIRKGHPKLFVMDNIDPDTFSQMLSICPIEETLFNAISKSGETAETMCQLMIVLDMIEKTVGKDKVKEHLVLTTSPKIENAPKSLFHPIVEKYELTQFDIPLNVGGRFSVFSPVGLFPSAILGFNIQEMLEGCEKMDELCLNPNLELNPAYQFSAIHYLLDKNKGKKVSVMMPYSDKLKDIADWYRQLWAESLGKKYDLNGNIVYSGQTPIKALGVTDQHSQIQLYREGPNDKIINIIKVNNFDNILKIPNILSEISELDYLRDKTMNALLAAELIGTRDALVLSQRPVITIEIDEVREYTVAQLMYMLEVATAMAGKLYGVNAFDQPGVEEGKRIARELMRKIQV